MKNKMKQLNQVIKENLMKILQIAVKYYHKIIIIIIQKINLLTTRKETYLKII